MKRLLCILCIVWLPVLVCADQYLCVAEDATGFKYNEISKKWETVSFIVDDKKYIISHADEPGYVYKVQKLGDKIPDAKCTNDFTEFGFLYCEGFRKFYYNRKNGRYLSAYLFGYYTVLPETTDIITESGDTPSIEIGKCSAF